MPLTINQVLLIVLTFTAVVVAVFLILLFAQLRKTAAEGLKALAEMRALAQHLTELDLVIKDKIETLGVTLEASKKAALNISQASALVTSNIGRPGSRYLLVLLPVARFLLSQWKKRKEKKT